MRNCLISPSLLTHNIYRLIRDVLVPEKTRELGDLIIVVNRSEQNSLFIACKSTFRELGNSGIRQLNNSSKPF